VSFFSSKEGAIAALHNDVVIAALHSDCHMKDKIVIQK